MKKILVVAIAFSSINAFASSTDYVYVTYTSFPIFMQNYKVKVPTGTQSLNCELKKEFSVNGVVNENVADTFSFGLENNTEFDDAYQMYITRNFISNQPAPYNYNISAESFDFGEDYSSLYASLGTKDGDYALASSLTIGNYKKVKYVAKMMSDGETEIEFLDITETGKEIVMENNGEKLVMTVKCESFE